MRREYRKLGTCPHCGREVGVTVTLYDSPPLLGEEKYYIDRQGFHKCERCGVKVCSSCITEAYGMTGLWQEVVGYFKTIQVCYPCYRKLHETVRHLWQIRYGPETDYHRNPY